MWTTPHEETTIDSYAYQAGLVQGQLGAGSAAAVVGIAFIAIVLGLTALRLRRS